MADPTEHDWVERAKKGDRAAIAELYTRYWRAARAAAYGVTGDLSVAEDAASEGFWLALQGLADLNDPARLGPWLRTIVVRSARRAKTANARHKGGELQEFPDTKALSTDAEMEQRELAALIHQAVGRLPEGLREAVSLFYFEGYNLKDAAAFLDVPAGTLKRRLHEARRRLKDAASAILEGRKSMDPGQERALQRLRDLLGQEPEPNSEVLLEAMREVGKVRPLPQGLLHGAFNQFWQRRMQRRREAHPARFERIEGMLPRLMARWLGPSSRAMDPGHPVAQAAKAIREALPGFKAWQPDVSEAARVMLKGQFPIGLPPGFAEGSPGAYISTRRIWLIKNEDGSVCTATQVMLEATREPEGLKGMFQDGHLSDALHLWWLDEGRMELHCVEDLLRRLATTVVPGNQVRFTAYEEPRFRAALRMQLGDIQVPAAMGGILTACPGMPEGVSTASVDLCLEAWATARSGEVIELDSLAPMMEELKTLRDQPPVS